MAKEVIMPKVDMVMETGTFVEWLKEEGDTVEKDEPIFIGKEIARHKDYSEETAQKIDNEIRDIVHNSLEKAHKILSDNRGMLNELSAALVARETLDDAQIRELLDLPPAKPQEKAEGSDED